MPPTAPNASAAPQVALNLAPTMLIGLGGSGKNVLLRIRRLFFERYGHVGFPLIGYLLLDTDSRAFNRMTGDDSSDFIRQQTSFNRDGGIIPEAIDCSVSPKDFDDYFAGGKEHYPHIFSWLMKEMNKYGSASITDGAGQHRPFGRLAFYHHFTSQTKNQPGIRETLQARIEQIIGKINEAVDQLPPGTQIARDRLDIVLVYSLAGGTGAGMFLDVAMLARHIVDTQLKNKNITPHLTHYAVLPEVFVRSPWNDSTNTVPTSEQRVKIQENAFACLREMEYFAMRSRQSYDLSIPPPIPAKDRQLQMPGSQEPARTDELYKALWVHPKETRDPHSRPCSIESAPWDACYLVGASNDLGETNLTDKELYEMIAEKIFLDFDPSDFGTEKRSLDSNLKHQTTSELHLPVIRDHQGKPLYSRSISKRFSTFSLSQLCFDRVRMRRAAGYRLAWNLITKWWLRLADVPPEAVDKMARQDLGDPKWDEGEDDSGKRTVTATGMRGDERPLALTYKPLRHQLLVEDPQNRERTYWTLLEEEYQQRRTQVNEGRHDSGSEPITPWVAEHERRLRRTREGGQVEDGRALQTFHYNQIRLREEIELRLRCLVQHRLQDLGVPGTLELLRQYAKLYKNPLEQGNQALNWHPAMSVDYRDRIAEAASLPWMARRAVRIELHRGLLQARTYLRHRYHREAVPDLNRCFQLVGRRLQTGAGEGQEGSYFQILTRFQNAVQNQEGSITHYLSQRFQDLSREDTTRKRTKGLLEDLSPKDYDKRIRRLLEKSQPDEEWNWPKIENEILEKLRQTSQKWEGAHSLGGVLFALFQLDSSAPPPASALHEFAENLAEACEAQLQGFASEVTALNLFQQIPDAVKRSKYLRDLRAYSAPFLRRDTDTDLPKDVDVEIVQLLGITAGTQADKAKFVTVLRNPSEFDPQDKTHSGLTALRTYAMADNAIVLYQQKTGLPLCYFADLNEYGRLYDISTRLMETHFDYPVLLDKLPEIRKVDKETQKLLGECWELALLGIMTRILPYKKNEGSRPQEGAKPRDDSEWGAFTLERTDDGWGSLTYKVGSDLTELTRRFAGNEEDFRNLRKRLEQWHGQATADENGQRIVILWYALHDLYEEIRSRSQYQINSDQASKQPPKAQPPALAILGTRTLPLVAKWVDNLGDDGARWVDKRLSVREIKKDDDLSDAQKQDALKRRRRVLEKCYRPVDGERIPIPVLVKDAQLDFALLDGTDNEAEPTTHSNYQPPHVKPSHSGDSGKSIFLPDADLSPFQDDDIP